MAKASAMALYVAGKCRGSPKRRDLSFEVEVAAEEDARLLIAG